MYPLCSHKCCDSSLSKPLLLKEDASPRDSFRVHPKGSNEEGEPYGRFGPSKEQTHLLSSISNKSAPYRPCISST